jgi:tetratricopeptide (TPR) repeat protein
MLGLPADPRRAAIATVSCVAAIVLALGARTARAEEKAADKAAAKEHYAHARSLYDLGHFAEAAKEFEAAYELKNDPAFLYDLAQSYRQAGNPEQALHFYRTYLRYVPKPANRAEIDERIAALEQQLAQKGTGTGTEPPPPPLTPPPPTTPPPPPQATPTTQTPPAGAGANVVVVPPPPEGAPPVVVEPIGPPTVDRGKTLRIAGIVTAGVGAFMLLVGIVEYGVAKSASDQVNSDATKGNAFDPNVEKRGMSAQTAEAWFFTLGVLAGAGGAALWYYGHLRRAEPETTYRVSLAPVIAPGGGGAWLRLRF